MQSLRASIYLAYLVAIVCLALELCLRFGVVASEAYKIDTSIAGMREGPRALILGDSFSVDGDDSFGRLLGEYLSARDIRSLNLARSGFGYGDYLSMLQRYGVAFQPDIVIVNTYVGNDTSDTAYRPARTRGGKQFAKRWLARSYLGSLLLEVREKAISKNRLERVARVRESRGRGPSELVNPFLVELSWAHPDCFLTNLLLETPDALPAWEANQATLLEIERIADSMNARLLLSVLPDSVQVNDSHHAFYKELGFTLDARMLGTSIPQDLLGRFCADHELWCLDLLPAFRQHREHELYKTGDSHWNAEGNRLAFEVVRDELERSSAVGTRTRPESGVAVDLPQPGDDRPSIDVRRPAARVSPAAK